MRDNRSPEKRYPAQGEMPANNDEIRPPKGSWFDLKPFLLSSEKPVYLTTGKDVWAFDKFSNQWLRCVIVNTNPGKINSKLCECMILDKFWNKRVIEIEWQKSDKILGCRVNNAEKIKSDKIDPPQHENIQPQPQISTGFSNRRRIAGVVDDDLVFLNQQDVLGAIKRGRKVRMGSTENTKSETSDKEE